MDTHDFRPLPVALNAIGMAVIAYAFVASRMAERGGWFVVALVLALLAWAITQATTSFTGLERNRVLRVVRLVAIFVGVVVNSLAQAPTLGIHTAPLAVVMIIVLSDTRETIWVGLAAAALSFALTPIGLVIAHASAGTALGYLAGNAVWLMIGISRRQARLATRRNQQLLEQQQAAHEQQARASALAARQTAARDIHDVLAHSLGGLVIQLDAAEALLESGRTADAQAKVGQARRLAADGLADARRAVAALRSPDETGASEQAPSDLAGAVERLLRAHRELGGEVVAHIELAATPQPLPASVATAFERALQEALSNARRHAPGAPVDVELDAGDGRLRLTVSNPAPISSARSDAGGGHGLTGMTERFAELDGGSVSADERGGRFVVEATARIAGS